MEDIKNIQFIYGGNAIFTVSNGKGKHYTFKVRQKEGSPYFVSVLSRPERYVYMGILTNGQLKLTKKSKFKDTSQCIQVFNWSLNMIRQIQVNQKKLPKGYRIIHEGKCCRCGRTLTTPESVKKGIGPECEKMINKLDLGKF